MSNSINAEITHSDSASNPRYLFDSRASLAFVYALVIIGPIVFLTLPVLLGALYVEFGFSEAQLGSFATTELIGMALSAATALYWIKHWNWRRVIQIALAISVVGNTITYLQLGTIEFNQLLALRFAIGLAGGAMMAVVLGFLSQQKDVDKAAGGLVFVQVAFQVFSLYMLPQIMASEGFFAGSKGTFALFAIFALVLLPLAGRIPTGALSDEHSHADTDSNSDSGSKAPALLVLGSFVLFFITQTSIWGFLELMGTQSGLSQEDAILAVSLSTGFSLAGPLFAIVFGDRFGRFKPLLFAAALQVVSLALLGTLGLNFTLYLVLLSVFQMGWNLAIGYQFSALVGVDPSHRFVVLVPTFQAIGIALGPLAGGLAIEAFSYGGLLALAGISFALYCAMILPVARSEERDA